MGGNTRISKVKEIAAIQVSAGRRWGRERGQEDFVRVVRVTLLIKGR